MSTAFQASIRRFGPRSFMINSLAFSESRRVLKLQLLRTYGVPEGAFFAMVYREKFDPLQQDGFHGG